jgi:glucans biosynthesis protein
VEITGLSEFGDNIVAYWRPQEPFQAGDERHYRYTIRTFDRRLPQQTLAQVERTVIGWDALPGEGDPPPRSQRRFVVDFVPGDSAPVPAPGEGPRVDPDGGGGGEPDTAPLVEAALRSSSGTLSDIRVLPLPGGGWRATFRLQPEGTAPADLLLHLVRGDTTLSETWSYLWIPESDG